MSGIVHIAFIAMYSNELFVFLPSQNVTVTGPCSLIQIAVLLHPAHNCYMYYIYTSTHTYATQHIAAISNMGRDSF